MLTFSLAAAGAKSRCGSESRVVILHRGEISLSPKLRRGMYCALPGIDLPALWIHAFPAKTPSK